MAIVTVGIDLAKNVFAVHDVDATGKPVLGEIFYPLARTQQPGAPSALVVIAIATSLRSSQ